MSEGTQFAIFFLVLFGAAVGIVAFVYLVDLAARKRNEK